MDLHDNLTPPWDAEDAPPGFIKDKIKNGARQLFDQILDGRYSFGARLASERDLASELGLTRDAIRQVIDFLEAYEVVKRRSGSGTFVTYRASAPRQSKPPATTNCNQWLDICSIVDAASPFELTIVCSIIEPEMVRLAAMYMSASDLRALDQSMQRISKIVTEAKDFVEAERSFMLTIAQGTHNPILSAMYNVIDAVRREPAWQRIREQALTPARIADNKSKLKSLHDALTTRDIETAVEFMKLIVADDNDAMISRA